MKALVYEGAEKLALRELPISEPGEQEVLLRIRSCGICGSDVHGYLGLTGRRIEPMVMGHEFSAQVERLGPGCSGRFQAGDRVTVQPVNFCGHCVNCQAGATNVCLNKAFYGVLDVNGALAEFLTVPEKLLYHLPDALSYEEGALIEPLAVSYCGVKKAGDLKNKKVLIIGAGTIGLLALSVAKKLDPALLVVSDLSDHRLAQAVHFGADHTINPLRDDFGQQVETFTEGTKFDVTIEAVGVNATAVQALSALRVNGVSVWIGNSAKDITIDMQQVVTQALSILGTYIYTHEEFGEALNFAQENGLDLSRFISRRVTLEEAADQFASLVKNEANELKVVVNF